MKEKRDLESELDLLNIDGLSLDDLGNLDDLNLDDIDLSDLDLDDLDFDDSKNKKIREPFSNDDVDLNFDDLLDEGDGSNQDIANVNTIKDEIGADVSDLIDDAFDDLSNDIQDSSSNDDYEESTVELDDMAALDELLSGGDNSEQINDNDSLNESITDNPDSTGENELSEDVELSEEMESMGEDNPNLESGDTDMDLDDLFQALGIEDESGDGESYTSNESELDDMFQASIEAGVDSGELDDIQDISEVKASKKNKSKKEKSKDKSAEKKSLSTILFGEPDADDIEEEKYLEELKINKAEKKAKKKEQKEEKKAKKQEEKALKESQALQKKKEKEEQKKAAAGEALAEEDNEKKVSTPVVIIVFVAFAIMASVVVFGTKEFNYSQVIKKATDYFERQRYRLAYDEVSGVEVKEKDEELRDRIYTVMYVERLYESYQNNMKLGRADKALDALVRGVEKYDEHYEEAIELNIVDDINGCKEKIMDSLWNTFNMTEQDVYDIMQLEGQEYTDALKLKCSSIAIGE